MKVTNFVERIKASIIHFNLYSMELNAFMTENRISTISESIVIFLGSLVMKLVTIDLLQSLNA